MRSRISLFALLLVFGSVALPLVAHAGGIPFFGPIIPNEQITVNGVVTNQNVCAAGWGMLITVINNIISLLITLAIVFVAPLMIAYAGFLLVISQGDSGKRTEARKILTNTIVGIVIALAGWMIVAAIMAALYNPETPINGGKLGIWSDLIGGNSAKLCIPLAGSLKPAVAPPPVVVVPGCPTCVSLIDKDLTCKIASSCTLDPTVADRLVTLKNNFSGTWTVTEAFPPTVTHSNPCHANGTCIDAGFRGSTAYTDANVAEFATDARSAGLRPVFETVSCSLRDQTRARGVTAYCVTDQGYGHITGNHFSIYAN